MASLERPGLRKIGFLKKLKTMKKKLFVLYQDDGNQFARLEYYDSEKKYKSGHSAKRTIILKDCLSINPKSDAKHKHAIALYTKDDCFGIACDNEAEQREWLGALEELQHQIHEPATDGESPRPNFEHIWPVQVKNRGLGGSSLQPGQYRLCLTNKSLSFIKISNTQPDIGFQLASIRRCGHTDAFFYMELGRSSATGAGELWMQVEDTVIAQNMHEAILSSMKTMNTAAEQPTYRPRSRSSADKSIKPGGARHSTISNAEGSTATLPVRSNTVSASQWEHPKSPLRRHQSTSKSSLPSSSSSSLHRSATMSYRESTYRDTYRDSTQSSYNRDSNAVAGSPLSGLPFGSTSSTEGMYRQRTDSMGSSSHRTDSSLSDDVDAATANQSQHSHYGSDHFMLEQQPYLDMQPTSKELSESVSGEGYMDMTPGGGRRQLSVNEDPHTSTAGPEAGYMNMSPANTDYSGAESPAVSMTSCHEDDYMDVGSMIGSRSLSTVQERAPGDPSCSYMEMKGGGGGSKHAHAMSMHLEKVPSFLSDDSFGGSSSVGVMDFPLRANSCGSRTDAVQKTQSYAYLDMTGGTLDKKKVGSASNRNSSKSISAPHLPPAVAPKQGLPKPRTDSCSSSTADVTDGRFMVMDFTRKESGSNSGSNSGLAGIRPRTSSGGSHRDMEIRPRTSSCGQQDQGFRSRTSSFGSIAKNLMLGRHKQDVEGRERGNNNGGGGGGTGGVDGVQAHRPRTATICQDAFRNRTGSFGPADAMRPRSVSHGNARYRELRRPCASSGSGFLGGGSVPGSSSRFSSAESLKGKAAAVVGRISSRESVASSNSEYLDMNPGGRGSPSISISSSSSFRSTGKDRKTVPSTAVLSSPMLQDEYMQMSPPSSAASMDDYVPMDPPSSSSSTGKKSEPPYPQYSQPRSQHQQHQRTGSSGYSGKSQGVTSTGSKPKSRSSGGHHPNGGSSSSSSSLLGKHHSSSESLSSGSEGGRARTRVVLSTAGSVDSGMGSASQEQQNEYMGFDFQPSNRSSQPNPSSTTGSTNRSSQPNPSSTTGSRSPKFLSGPSGLNEPDSYVSYSPAGGSREHSPNLTRGSPSMDKVISPIRESCSSGGGGLSLAPPFNPSPMLGSKFGGSKKPNSGQGNKHEYVNVQYKQTETVYEQMEYQNQDTPEDTTPTQTPKAESKPSLPGSRNTTIMPEDEYMDFDFGPGTPKTESGSTRTREQEKKDPKRGEAMEQEQESYMEYNPCSSSNRDNSKDSRQVQVQQEDEDSSYMLCDPAPEPGSHIRPVNPSSSSSSSSLSSSLSSHQQQQHIHIQQQIQQQHIDRELGVVKVTVSGKMSSLQQQPKPHHHHLISAARYSPPPTLTSASPTSTSLVRPVSTVSLKSALLAANPVSSQNTPVASSSSQSLSSSQSRTTTSLPSSVSKSQPASTAESPYMDFSPASSGNVAKTSKTEMSDYMDFQPGASTTNSTKETKAEALATSQSNSKTTSNETLSNALKITEKDLKKDDSEGQENGALNYATLDLGDATDDSAKSSGQKRAPIPGEEGDAASVVRPAYAEIDFKKSEEMVQTQEQESKKEKDIKAPFDL